MSKVGLVGWILIIGEYFFFTVRYENKLKRGIRNITTLENFLFESSKTIWKPGFSFDLVSDEFIWPLYCNKDYFITLIESHKLKNDTAYSCISTAEKINNNPCVVKIILKKTSFETNIP
ncbi:MAG: hypothetical protein JW717_10410 [Marinilabiliaceae bacterium]|nr:hypothetical protein [Marinilabiliaceae bacterium]